MHVGRRSFARSVIAFGLALGFAADLRADDWPQYRGVNHDGVTKEQINTDWSAGKPKELWRIPFGEGFGSFAAVGDKVFYLTTVPGSVSDATQKTAMLNESVVLTNRFTLAAKMVDRGDVGAAGTAMKVYAV